ncbi:MAG: glucose-6-phosphate isomerase [Gammaproteobacteria bacterium RBG_16_37_9]|nr:MAG: glucose-6-phosphate isomerase [Gammaproteobacteria bacterium RBG_16_37_9]
MDDKPDISNAWQALTKHCHQNSNLKIKDQFATYPERFSEFSLEAAGIFLDYSKNRITTETMRLLCDLAKAAEVSRHREEMFCGKEINITEKRAVLHTALRNIHDESTPESVLVKKELKRMADCVHSILGGKWSGYSGKLITDVVNIGIGGSDLGPAMAVAALQPYGNHIKAHFVSNIDSTHINETIKYLNPETTVFIVTSKTFTTQETLVNAITAREWLLNKAAIEKKTIEKHFIGITANPTRAIEFGISQENIFSFWDWVGGRFSLWSAVGLSIALAIGMDKFYEFLEGAHAMDKHFESAPLEENMPVILALLGIWNIDFLGAQAQAIIPYDQYLELFPTYLQQLEMESNGKRVCVDGSDVSYKTAPIVWGGVGTNSQHSFHQLLMQGTHMVPVDFIIPLQTHSPIGNHHLLLYANCLAQSQALMCGCGEEDVIAELKLQGMSKEQIHNLMPHKIIPGNVPSNTIVMDKIEPSTLGALIALYEHKVFVQGIIWRINSFDQWGVELGKRMASKLVPMLQGESEATGLDGSTQGLINLITCHPRA